jgi:2-polyprenyl-3-methyl-5-hydroxy-6-metoxy-1,4-benzoquinol methylase
MNHSGRILDQEEKFNIIKCNTCNFKHLNPIPTEEELALFYKKEYFQTAKPDYLSEDREEIKHRNIFFDQRIDFFKKNSKGKSLLDVGCGDGIFLERARKSGFDVFGIEPSEKASIIARSNNLKIYNGTLNTYIKNNNKLFDIVHLKNVLEHVNSPIDVLDECIKLLNPGGILYTEVPNDYNPFQIFGSWINKERKSWICIPDHINYFNFQSLEKLLIKKKLKILRRDTTFPMYIFLCLGLNFIKNKKLGKKLHLLRVKTELFCFNNYLNDLRHFLYRKLAQLGLGRTVIIYAKKVSR